MEISVIVPSNSAERTNEFLKSFHTMKEFNKHCKIIIVANNEFNTNNIINTSENYNVRIIYKNEFHKDGIVPFLSYRWNGIKENPFFDYCLFLDDDHKFSKESDRYFMNCITLLNELKDCSVLCTDRNRDGKNGVELKEDGFIWTNRGLFIKNIFNKIKPDLSLLGAGEDLLLSYLVLSIEGLPYIYYGSEVTRVEKRYKNGIQVKNDMSYSKETMNNNIIGFIRNEFNDKDWIHENRNNHVFYPKKLQNKINERVNENISNSSKQ